MAYAFNMQLRTQQEWSWLLAIDLFLGGLGGGLFLLFEFSKLRVRFGLLAMGLVVLGGIVLLSELGKPWRAWRAICRPQTSWISRGVLAISLFLITGSLYLAPAVPGFSSLPWAGDTHTSSILACVSGISALFIILYPGFVLSYPRAIPFWNSRLLPVLFFTQAAMGASGIVLLISGFSSIGQDIHQIASLAIVLIVINLLAISLYLLSMNRAGAAAKEAVRILKQGSLGWTFGGGAILVGMTLPLLMLALFPASVVLAGAFIVIGALLFRYCVLKAGVYVPPALAGMDMSRLCRADGELAREYAAMTARQP